MSIDFSEEFEAPLVTASMTPQDEGEFSLRPRTLMDYTGQEKAKGNLRIYLRTSMRGKMPQKYGR